MHLAISILITAGKVSLFALSTVVFLLRTGFRLPGHVRQARRLLATQLSCPSCGHENAVAGRWSCSCGAVYLGFVGECSICGASCSFFPCERCGGSIPVGRMS